MTRSWTKFLRLTELLILQTLLQVMNETILDAYSDELQLLRVEDILPLTGPSSVSLYTSRNQSLDSPPTPMRKLLEGDSLLISGISASDPNVTFCSFSTLYNALLVAMHES